MHDFCFTLPYGFAVLIGGAFEKRRNSYLALALETLCALALTYVMGQRYFETSKIMPAGVVAGLRVRWWRTGIEHHSLMTMRSLFSPSEQKGFGGKGAYCGGERGEASAHPSAVEVTLQETELDDEYSAILEHDSGQSDSDPNFEEIGEAEDDGNNEAGFDTLKYVHH
ncbi:hypothetical protein E2562_034653 [Oryza meyeriana var. granulata]|uniref:Uncharacterized protein n=1 Tax=Oryza meyeriana var. granulata TaxID=110450 RepID=A0A6G1EC92_9ORYZ|nr:hypothetical protein E2562_034653 [Oryza meyeriana var. granulata]